MDVHMLASSVYRFCEFPPRGVSASALCGFLPVSGTLSKVVFWDLCQPRVKSFSLLFLRPAGVLEQSDVSRDGIPFLSILQNNLVWNGEDADTEPHKEGAGPVWMLGSQQSRLGRGEFSCALCR